VFEVRVSQYAFLGSGEWDIAAIKLVQKNFGRKRKEKVKQNIER